MIDLNLMRLKSLFDSINDNNSQTSPTMPMDNNIGGLNLNSNNSYPTGSSDSGDSSFLSQIAKMFQPREDQFNALTSLAGNMPNKDDYKPSLGRKISAYLTGIGTGSGPAGMYGGNPVGFKGDIPAGLKMEESILDEPYNKALGTWANKLEPLEKTATIEGSRNTNDRLIGSQMLTNERSRVKQESLNQLNEDKLGQNQQKIDISRAREEAYTAAKNWAMSHPTYEGKVDNDGMLVYVNKTNPADIVKTDIKTGALSDIQKNELRLSTGLKLAEARGDQQRQTNTENAETKKSNNWSQPYNTKDENDKDVVAQINNDTGEIRILKTPSLSKIKTDRELNPESQTQQKQGLINKANQIISQHPELKSYFIFDKNNAGTVQGVKVAPPGLFGDQSKSDMATSLLYGDNKSTTDKTIKPTVRQDGKTHVKLKSSDQTGWVTNPDMSLYELIP